jgi:hypothetical protein
MMVPPLGVAHAHVEPVYLFRICSFLDTHGLSTDLQELVIYLLLPKEIFFVVFELEGNQSFSGKVGQLEACSFAV